MEYKKNKYILFLIMVFFIGIGVANAESKKCYYMSEDNTFKAELQLTWGEGCVGLSDCANIRVDKIGEGQFDMDDEHLNNWWAGGFFKNWYDQCTKKDKVCFDPYYDDQGEANAAVNPSCPAFIVFQHCTTYEVWGTESESIAKKAYDEINKIDGCVGHYASPKNESGQLNTKEDYFAEFVFEGIIDIDDQGEVTCADYESIFGSKDDPDSVRGIANTVLEYVRVLVPILVILLGVIDLSKAVIAGKEDNMKKAQKDFIKRIIIGLAIFFVPLLVDVIMNLADYAWDGKYFHCKL